jgi:hypothetical protein
MPGAHRRGNAGRDTAREIRLGPLVKHNRRHVCWPRSHHVIYRVRKEQSDDCKARPFPKQHPTLDQSNRGAVGRPRRPHRKRGVPGVRPSRRARVWELRPKESRRHNRRRGLEIPRHVRCVAAHTRHKPAWVRTPKLCQSIQIVLGDLGRERVDCGRGPVGASAALGCRVDLAGGRHLQLCVRPFGRGTPRRNVQLGGISARCRGRATKPSPKSGAKEDVDLLPCRENPAVVPHPAVSNGREDTNQETTPAVPRGSCTHAVRDQISHGILTQ